jgi:hypothetical protein
LPVYATYGTNNHHARDAEVDRDRGKRGPDERVEIRCGKRNPDDGGTQSIEQYAQCLFDPSLL